MVSEKLVMDMLAKAGVSAATKSLINSILSSVGSYINAKALIRYLNGSDGMIGYLMYHVAKVLKVRTIHSNEIDIYIDDVYEPLTLVKKQKTLSNVDSLKCDENIEFIDRYVNIIGVAGQGKSTILRKFFLETLKRKKELPIFIELRKLDEVTLFKYIKSIFNNIGFQTEDVHVRELLKSGVVVLLLDGFDEVQFNHRMKLLSEINDIVQSPEFDIKIIITTRPGTEVCNETLLANYWVDKLNKGDIINIIKRLKKNDNIITEQDATNLISKINDKDDNLSSVLIYPLLVTLFYICYPYIDAIPRNITEFYSSLFTTLYLRHDKIKNYERNKKSILNNKDAFECFCAFCFFASQKGKLNFSKNEMVGLIVKSIEAKSFNNYGSLSIDAENISDDIIDITCLVQSDGYDSYSFLHKSVAEFHTAKFISELPSEIKIKLYEKIGEDIYSNRNNNYLSIIGFLIDLDRSDVSKHILIPILEKEGINHWSNVSDEDIKYIIHDVLTRVRFVGVGSGTISAMHYNSKYHWWRAFFDSKNIESHFYNIIFHEASLINLNNVAIRSTVGEYIEVDGKNILIYLDVSKIIKEFRGVIDEIYNDVYMKTKMKIKDNEDNLLSLLAL